MVRFATTLLAVFALALAASPLLAQDRPDPNALKGKVAPDFKLKTLDEQEVKLSDLKGKVVLIDFWATWCPPCRKSLPHVQEMSKDKALTDKGLKVLAVNAREKEDKIKPFMETNNYSFTVPLDAEGTAMKAYGVTGIPTTVIVGRDGKVRAVFVGFGGEQTAKEIHKAVEEALSENAPV